MASSNIVVANKPLARNAAVTVEAFQQPEETPTSQQSPLGA